jgi:hypothetical protein
MKYLVWVLVGMLSVGLCAVASLGQAALVPAC